MRGGDEVTVLAPHGPQVPAAWDEGSRDEAGVVVKAFRYAPERFELLGYSRSLQKDETMKLGAAAVTPLYLRAARGAVVAELEGQAYDLLQAHWVVPNALAALGLGSRLGERGALAVPVAVGLHGSDVFLAEKPLVRRAVGRALARTAVLTGCSPELVERVCALGFPAQRARVIPYGVDARQFSPRRDRRGIWREKLGIPPEAPMIVSVGRMATKKGYQHLMPILKELFAAHPAAHLVLAGGGDRLEEFRRAAAPWSSQVHFPGAVYRDTLPDLYRAADLFVLPAVHDPKGNVDGLPNVILEAMACGLPVVASAISGIPLAVEDGGNGRLVPEGDQGALLEALKALLAAPQRARALGEAGRKKVERELTWDAVAARYRQAYELATGPEPGNNGENR